MMFDWQCRRIYSVQFLFPQKNVFDEKISEIDWKSTTIRNYLLIDERNKSKENKIIDRNTAEMIDDVLEL